MRHSLRYFRHSGSVIYMSKLPAPSVSMPCDYRILQSSTKGQVLLVIFETAARSQVKLVISETAQRSPISFTKIKKRLKPALPGEPQSLSNFKTLLILRELCIRLYSKPIKRE